MHCGVSLQSGIDTWPKRCGFTRYPASDPAASNPLECADRARQG
jgi:hypothetical protein